jgi:trimeric autotransporter adhesin
MTPATPHFLHRLFSSATMEQMAALKAAIGALRDAAAGLEARASDAVRQSLTHSSHQARARDFSLLSRAPPSSHHTQATSPPVLPQPPSSSAPDASRAVLLLADVKAANRAASLAVEELRQEVASASATADERHLSLQNLLYEKAHLLREIHKCRDFPTPELDKISLCPVEEMLRDAPELAVAPAAAPTTPEAAGSSSSSSAAASEESAHQLQLNRLQHERNTRKALEAQLEEAKARLAALRATNRARRDHLGTLPAAAKGLAAALTSIGSGLGVPSSAAGGPLAARVLGLPRPLFAAYSQIDAAATLERGREAGAAAPSAAGSAPVVAVDVAASVTPTLSASANPSHRPAVPVARFQLYAAALGLSAAIAVPSQAASAAAAAASASAGGVPGKKRPRSDAEEADGPARAEGAPFLVDGGRLVSLSPADAFRPHPQAVLVAVRTGPAAVAGVRLQFYPLLDLVTAAAVGARDPGAGQLAGMLSGGAGASAGGAAASSSSSLTVSELPAGVLEDLLGEKDDGRSHPRWVAACVASPAPPLVATPKRSSAGPGAEGGHDDEGMDDGAEEDGGLPSTSAESAGDSAATVPPLPLDPSSSSSSSGGGGGAYFFASLLAGYSGLLPPHGYTGPLAPSVQTIVRALRTRLSVASAVSAQIASLASVTGPTSLSVLGALLGDDAKGPALAAHYAALGPKLAALAQCGAGQAVKVGGPRLLDLQPALPSVAALLRALDDRVRVGGAGTDAATLISVAEVDLARAPAFFEGAGEACAPGAGAHLLHATIVSPATKGQGKAAGAGAGAGAGATTTVHITLAALLLIPRGFPDPSQPLRLHVVPVGVAPTGAKGVTPPKLPSSAATADKAGASLLRSLDVAVGGATDAAAGFRGLSNLLSASAPLLCPTPSSFALAGVHLLHALLHLLPAVLARPPRVDLAAEVPALAPVPPVHQAAGGWAGETSRLTVVGGKAGLVWG